LYCCDVDVPADPVEITDELLFANYIDEVRCALDYGLINPIPQFETGIF